MANLLTNAYIIKRYEQLKKFAGADVATYICCAICDAPYYPNKTANTWQEYVELTGCTKDSRFTQGETDFYVATEQVEETQFDKWKATWGVGDEESPYTEQDYERLDELFDILSERQKSAGGMDAQREHTLRVCASLSLLQEKCIAKGDKENIDKAAKLDKMIQDNLSAEALRWKDAKPTESTRVDGFVDAIRRKYGLEVEMTYDDVMEAFRKWLQSHRYPETIDAADHALLAIINMTRENNDMPTLTELPTEAKFPRDSVEFNAIPNEQEKEVFEYLDINKFKKKT